MDFFNAALLSDDKIHQIKKTVKAALNDNESLAQFLLDQYSWKLRLETVYASEIRSIQEGLFQKLDALEEEKGKMPSLLYVEQSAQLRDEYNDIIKVWFKSKTEEIIESFKVIVGKKRKRESCGEV